MHACIASCSRLAIIQSSTRVLSLPFPPPVHYHRSRVGPAHCDEAGGSTDKPFEVPCSGRRDNTGMRSCSSWTLLLQGGEGGEGREHGYMHGRKVYMRNNGEAPDLAIQNKLGFGNN
uniref:Uncharacterized protein n=1 Tax=Oryza rufipogon TaxID=4529 RepID=A0A0E0Q445_ORYRU